MAVIGTAAVAVLPAGAQSDGPQGQSGLEVYVGEVDAAGVEKMRALGLDADDFVVDAGAAGTTEVEAVLTDTQAAKLQAQGVELEVKMVGGKKASEVLLAQAEQGFDVFRPYSGDGGIQDEIMATAAENETLTEVVNVGSTVEGQDILALRVTANAANVPDGTRPAVLYAGAQHAREWITPEMVRRLMHYVLDKYSSDAEIT